MIKTYVYLYRNLYYIRNINIVCQFIFVFNIHWVNINLILYTFLIIVYIGDRIKKKEHLIIRLRRSF
jgi:hypothetical protein